MIAAALNHVAPVRSARSLPLLLGLALALSSMGTSAHAQTKKLIEENSAAIDQHSSQLTQLQGEARALQGRIYQLEQQLAEATEVLAQMQAEPQDDASDSQMAAQAQALRQLAEFQRETDSLRARIAALTELMEQSGTAQEAKVAELQQKVGQGLEDMERFRAAAAQEIGDINMEAEKSSSGALQNQFNLNRFWVLIAAFLVFFMQAGFKALEAGLVRPIHADNVAVKNLLDWLVVVVVFFAVGFGLMFGRTEGGWIGTSFFFPQVSDFQTISQSSGHGLGFEFFLFQLAFAGTAATIVSAAIAERTVLPTFLMLAVLTTLFYSFLGHWSWGGLFLESNEGFLAKRGFQDFAGSTVVHSLGAWVALAAVIVIRPRAGRYAEDGSIQYDRFRPNSMSYSALGVFILWFGWFGFNGGSVLAFTDEVALVIFNTCICAAMAGLAAFGHAWLAAGSRQNVYPKLIGGILGGLVAITACCNVVTVSEALMLGVLAGVVHNLAFDLMLRLRLDDVVGAVPVHGACGILGTLWVAVGQDTGAGMAQQLWIQAQGVGIIFACTFFPFLALCWMLNKLIGLRIGFVEEREGYMIGSRRDRKYT